MPGDEVRAVLDDDGRLARVEVLPAGATGERLEVAADGEQAVVTVTMPSLDGPPAELVTRWRAAGAGSFAAVDGDAGTIDFARHVLGCDRGAVPEHPLDPVEATWSCPAGLAGAHGAATAAAHDGPGLDLALTLAWPAVAALLSSAAFAARLAQLVHAGHSVLPGPAWPPRDGEHGRVLARIVALEDPDGAATRMTCRALLCSDRGELASVDVALMTLGGSAVTDRLRFERDTRVVELTLSHAEAGWLAARPWIEAASSFAPGDRVLVEVACTSDEPRTGPATWSASGTVTRDGERVATIDWREPPFPLRRARAPGPRRCAPPSTPSRAPWRRSLRPRRPAACARARCWPRRAMSRRRAWTRSRASAATTTRCTAASSRRGSEACRARSCTARGPRRARRRSSSRRSATATRARCAAGGSTSSRRSLAAPRSSSRPRSSACRRGCASSR